MSYETERKMHALDNRIAHPCTSGFVDGSLSPGCICVWLAEALVVTLGCHTGHFMRQRLWTEHARTKCHYLSRRQYYLLLTIYVNQVLHVPHIVPWHSNRRQTEKCVFLTNTRCAIKPKGRQPKSDRNRTENARTR